MCILARDLIRFWEAATRRADFPITSRNRSIYIQICCNGRANFILMGLHGKLTATAQPKLQSTLYLAYSN